MKKKNLPPPEWLTIPTPKTLEKYGINREEYIEICRRQDYKCPICGNELRKSVNIDHWHVNNYKKLLPDMRKLFIRGVLCWFDNYYAMYRSINLDKARNAVKYLEDFEKRKPK